MKASCCHHWAVLHPVVEQHRHTPIHTPISNISLTPGQLFQTLPGLQCASILCWPASTQLYPKSRLSLVTFFTHRGVMTRPALLKKYTTSCWVRAKELWQAMKKACVAHTSQTYLTWGVKLWTWQRLTGVSACLNGTVQVSDSIQDLHI